jgi:glycosyltransferase involved in cell wall biosynthesis
MLIAHVITRLLRAGSEENTIATCLAQARAGHQVLLVHGQEWDSIQRAKCADTINLVEIRDLVHRVDPRKDLKATVAMRDLFLRKRPTIVHTHQSKAGITGRIAARLARVPGIVHGVHILPFVNVGIAKKALYVAAERAVAGFTDAFIDVSEGTRQSCIEHAVGRPEQHFVAHSGFDIASFRDATVPENWQTLAGVAPGAERPPVILMLAALEDRKRHMAFLEVFGRVVQRIPDVRLLLAGEGPTRKAVAAAITNLNLSAHVRLLGFHAFPERLIALSDLTVLTSVREGLPRVIVQSLAGGRPVITTQLPGIAEIVTSGVNGIITPSEDLRLTADAIVGVLRDRARLTRMQAAAASTDVSSWDIDSMCSTVCEVYERLIDARAPAGILAGSRPDDS